MAAVIGRGIEGLADGDGCCSSSAAAAAADDYYDPNDDGNNNSNNNNSRSARCLQSPFILYYTVTYSMNGTSLAFRLLADYHYRRHRRIYSWISI
jgi:hypothetical protein